VEGAVSHALRWVKQHGDCEALMTRNTAFALAGWNDGMSKIPRLLLVSVFFCFMVLDMQT
jgi:hypothetical protein